VWCIHALKIVTLPGYREREGEMQVAISTPFGDHDINQLIFGEK
jgi:hypothetical protein